MVIDDPLTEYPLCGLICISLRHGIAVGTFINGQIYLGESGNAGLWGLSRAHLSHARPLPNHHDELDRVLGINALKQVFTQVYGRSGSNEEVVTSVFAAYESGEETVVQALDEYIVDLGSHIAELGYLFDISQFILTGYFVHCGEGFLRALTRVTREHLSTFRKHHVRIQKGMMGSEAAAWGAAYLIQEHLFK